jgi:hypothetical protein
MQRFRMIDFGARAKGKAVTMLDIAAFAGGQQGR